MSEGRISRFVRALIDGQPTKFTDQVLGHEVTYSVNATANGYDDPKNISPARMWKSQPHLRTVVEFQALMVSQLTLHAYKREEESSTRQKTGKLAELLKHPNDDDTMQEIIEALVADWALYNNAYLAVLPNKNGSFDIRVLPAAWVTPSTSKFYGVDYYSVANQDGGEPLKVPAENVIRFKGWTPGDPQTGTSPVDTLRLILAEQHSARIYRDQVWRKGGRTGGVILRPKDAPVWDNDGRKRFFKMIKAFTGDTGAHAGEDLLLEDGMTYQRVGLAAREEQFVESTKLSLETVCQVFHINPTMVGMLDNANYSNVREFRKGLYGDTLGHIIKRIENRLNSFLLPMIGADEDEFVEFNVEQMLRGSFEDQADLVFKATGRPWQTVAEARKLFNLPPIPGGDTLVMPLNLVPAGEEDEGEDGEETDEEPPQEEGPDPTKAAQVIKKFIDRQRKSVQAKKNAKQDWWDQDRWNRELSADLEKAGYSDGWSELIATGFNAKAHKVYQEAVDPTAELQGLGEIALTQLGINPGTITSE